MKTIHILSEDATEILIDTTTFTLVHPQVLTFPDTVTIEVEGLELDPGTHAFADGDSAILVPGVNPYAAALEGLSFSAVVLAPIFLILFFKSFWGGRTGL
jgi:hypothetical protein